MIVRDLYEGECRDLLTRLGFGRLGCANNDQPYVVPVYFVHEDNALFGFSTAGQKIEWMRANPLVCIEADEVLAQDNWSSVLVMGRYEEMPDIPKYAKLRAHAHSLLETRTLWWRLAIASSQTREGELQPVPILYCIHIDKITGHRASPDK
jgi:uncharacterized protein